MARCWLEERRKLFIKNLVKDFFDSYAFFVDLKAHTKKYGFRYDGFDFWVGTEQNKGKLWHLKDLCHLLWRESDPSKDDEGLMLDWMVGAIFHEAMKLKENTYMIDRYRASCPASKLGSARSVVGNGSYVCMEFFAEMEREIERGIKRLECLFGHAEERLKSVIRQEKDNALLVRYLLEVASDPVEHWPSDFNPHILLDTLFPEGLDQAYCLAGESYLEGSWFAEARESFEKALRLNPDCQEARYGLRLLERRIEELASVIKKEYELRVKNGAHQGFLNQAQLSTE